VRNNEVYYAWFIRYFDKVFAVRCFIKRSGCNSGGYSSSRMVRGNVKRPGLFELLHQDKVDWLGRRKLRFWFRTWCYSKQLKVYHVTSREKRIVNVNKIDFDALQWRGRWLIGLTVLKRFENLITIEGAVFCRRISLDNNPTFVKSYESAEGFQEDALSDA
jgi:hypothetical protein